MGVQDGIELCRCVKGDCSASLGYHCRNIKPQAIARQFDPGGSLIFIQNELMLKDVINMGTYVQACALRQGSVSSYDAITLFIYMYFTITAAILLLLSRLITVNHGKYRKCYWNFL